jgi:ABC-type lipoprotein release transport system permease subunit
MIISLSWKNVWRNPLRSGIVIASITIGLFGGIFSTAFMNGMGKQTIHAAVNTELAHVQLHNPSFIEEPLPKKTVDNAPSIMKKIASMEQVKAVSGSSKLTAMVSSAKTGRGVTVMGVVPDEKAKISIMPDKVIEGSWFETKKRNPVIIGKKLAEKLDVQVKNKIVLTMQAVDGELTGGAFRVAGIFSTYNSTFDNNTVFVRQSDIERLAHGDPPFIHEIAVLLDNYHASDSMSQVIAREFPETKVQTWAEIKPDVGMMESLMAQMMYIFVLIILLALTFGIVNTMLMAVMDRRREFGMLMAVGMSRGRIFSMILFETIILALTGGILGMFTGGAATVITHRTGVDLTSLAEGLAEIGYNPMVYPAIDISFFIILTVMVIITGIIASLYPAYKALSLDPAEAVRSET